MLKKTFTTTLFAIILTMNQFATADLLSSATEMLGDDALLGSLANSLEISEEQAGGSLGSILSLAEKQLPATDYASLTGLLPGAESYIKMAQDAGVLTEPITDIGRLNSAMDKLGISQETTSSIISKLGDFVGSTGGESLQKNLMGILE